MAIAVAVRSTDARPSKRPPTRREHTMLVNDARSGNAESRTAMVLRNQGLVQQIARKYGACGLALEDVVQEGQVGLIRAVDTFNPSLGFAFSTYATVCIHRAIRRALDNDVRLVRIPAHLGPAIARLREESAHHGNGAGDVSQLDRRAIGRVAAATGISSKICEAVAQALPAPVSLDAPVDNDGDTPRGAVVPDRAACDPERIAERHEVEQLLAEVLGTLPVREQAVVRARFGFDGPAETLDQVGARYGVTGERVRQIERSAIRRLRERCGMGKFGQMESLAHECEML